MKNHIILTVMYDEKPYHFSVPTQLEAGATTEAVRQTLNGQVAMDNMLVLDNLEILHEYFGYCIIRFNDGLAVGSYYIQDLEDL